MKRLGVLFVPLLVAFVAGCTPTAEVKPKAGPTPVATTQGPFQQSDGGSSELPSEEPSSDDQTANFNQSYTYEDGVEIEVTKVKHAKVSRSDAEYSDPVKKGADYFVLTFKVKNGSKSNLKDVYQFLSMTYGPDGEEAETPYIASRPDDTDLTGTIRPGKSKVGSETFAIPKKYQDDVQLEIDFESGHEAAVFAGSVK